MFHTFTCKTYLIELRFFRNMQSLLIFQSNAFATSVLSFLDTDIFKTPKYLVFNLKKKTFQIFKVKKTLTKCIVSDQAILSHRRICDIGKPCSEFNKVCK